MTIGALMNFYTCCANYLARHSILSSVAIDLSYLRAHLFLADVGGLLQTNLLSDFVTFLNPSQTHMEPPSLGVCRFTSQRWRARSIRTQPRSGTLRRTPLSGETSCTSLTPREPLTSLMLVSGNPLLHLAFITHCMKPCAPATDGGFTAKCKTSKSSKGHAASQRLPLSYQTLRLQTGD
jgi:hypothetical protein